MEWWAGALFPVSLVVVDLALLPLLYSLVSCSFGLDFAMLTFRQCVVLAIFLLSVCTFASLTAGQDGPARQQDDPEPGLLGDGVFAAEEYPEVPDEEGGAREAPAPAEGDSDAAGSPPSLVLDYEDVVAPEEDLLARNSSSANATDAAAEVDGEGEVAVEEEGGEEDATNSNITDASAPPLPKYSPRKVTCLLLNASQEASNETVEATESESGVTPASAEESEGGEEDRIKEEVIEVEATLVETVAENEVLLLNGSHFLRVLSEQNDSNVTNRTMPAKCSLGFFYASWCPFSASAAPHFNALPRVFPDLSMYAVDTSRHHGVNTQFGIMALPTVILFHNSKPVGKYNLSEYDVAQFSKYVTYFTGIEPGSEPALEDRDMEGPIPTKEVPVPDYYLYLAWAFTILCAVGYFVKSSLFQSIIESVRKAWREAEIHHEHED